MCEHVYKDKNLDGNMKTIIDMLKQQNSGYLDL